MLGPNARSVFAEMVNSQSVWDRTNEKFVTHPMGIELLPRNDYASVTSFGFGPCPFNTSLGPDEFGTKPIDEGPCSSTARHGFISRAGFSVTPHPVPMEAAKSLIEDRPLALFYTASDAGHLNARLDSFVAEVDGCEDRAHPLYRAGQILMPRFAILCRVKNILLQQC